MTLLAAQGFEGWTGFTGYPDQYSASTSTLPMGGLTSQARTGNSSWNDGGSGFGFGFDVKNADRDSTLIAGVAFTLLGQHEIMQFWGDRNSGGLNAGTQHITIYTAGSDLRVYRGDHTTGTLLASLPSGTLVGSSYLYLEAKVTLSDTVGAVTVRIDETTVISLSGIDTKNGGTATTLDGVNCYGTTSGSGNRFDDFYVCNTAGSVNNDFLGAIRVERLYPTGNGNSSQWTNDSGNSTNNWSHVADGLGVNTPDYVEANSTGLEDTYLTGNSVFSTASAVKGVIIHGFAEKTDAGARGVSYVARLSGVESTVAGSALVNGTYKDTWGVLETKPGGGSWTVADVNNAEFGIKTT